MSSEHKPEPRTPLGRGGKNMDKKKMSVAASPAQHHKDSDTNRRSTTSPTSQDVKYEPEMSDDESPLPQSHSDPVGNKSTISSSLQGAAAQMEHKKSGTPITQEIMSKEFWMDKKFLTQMMILGTLQALMTWGVHASLQGSIADLKACSRGSPGTDKSLPCSDCMCIATDGFSSAQFKNIIKDQETLSTEFKQKMKEQEEIETRLKKIETKAGDFKDLSHMEYTMQNLYKEIKDMPEYLKKDMMFTLENFTESRINDKLHNINEKINSEVQKKSTNLENKIQDIQGQVMSSEEMMNKHIDNERKMRESSIEEVMGNMSELKTAASQVMSNISELKTSIFENFTEVESKYEGMKGQVDYFFRELKDINIYIVGFLLVLVMGVIYVAYKILLGRPAHGEDRIRQVTQVHDPLPRSRLGGHSAAVNVEGITKRSLNKSIGMISFNASTKQFHQSLIDEVPKSRYVDLQPCLIQRLNDIPQIVPSKFVFIFVDFNERNIILEDPETEIGDLRRLTTQGVLNMGCDVFVVYVRDRGSKTLRPDQLYNPQLYSVERHPLLSKLKERNRMLSVYDRFLPHQVKFLADCLKRL